MGSPNKKKSGLSGFVSSVTDGASRAVTDIGTGLDQVAHGNVEDGLNNVGTGYLNTLTYGAGERVGLVGDRLQRETAGDANAQAQQEENDISAGKETARKDAIRKRLDAEVAMRSKHPGRSQTLLTDYNKTMSNLMPGSSNTLLTTGRR